MNPIHPSSVPVPPPVSRKPTCRPPAGRKARRRRRRKARLRCRLSLDERATLKEHHWRSALGFACRYGVLNPGAVADAAMEESLRVFRKRKGKFKALLFKLLRWRLASAYRQESRRRSVLVPLPTFAEDAEIAVESADPCADRADLKTHFLQAWHELDCVERQLLYLHHVEGRAFPDIQKSKMFRHRRWAVASLRCKVHRALRKLRVRLESFRDAPATVWFLVLQSIPLNGTAPQKRASCRKTTGHVRRNTTTSRSGCNS